MTKRRNSGRVDFMGFRVRRRKRKRRVRGPHRWRILLITLALLLGGCSNSKFALDLTERKLTTERWNSELDIGKIEYIEKANGDTHITVTSYKLAQAEIPLEWMRLAAAMYGGNILDVPGAVGAAVKAVKP